MWETIINILIFIMMFSLGFFLPKTALAFIILVRCATSITTDATEITLIGCVAGIMLRDIMESLQFWNNKNNKE